MTDEHRVLVWFSCGAASATAAKLAVEKYGARAELLYCDTLAYEHPDNARFLRDVEGWLGRKVRILRSTKYTDIFDVFRKRRFLKGVHGAPCTTHLKKNVREAYQRPGDIHVFGLTADEGARIERFEARQPDLKCDFVLAEAGINKADCFRVLTAAGIELPAMYRLGYGNANCVGCVKGGMGYWNKIRVDFPAAFQRMAQLERELGHALLKDRRGGKSRPLYLDELDPSAGRGVPLPDIGCGVVCAEQLDLPLGASDWARSGNRYTCGATRAEVRIENGDCLIRVDGRVVGAYCESELVYAQAEAIRNWPTEQTNG